MPSFDIVSEINMQEVDNAVNNARKEVITRYDFKNSKSEIQLEKDHLQLISDDDYKMKALVDILHSKLIKRGVDLKSLEMGKVEPAAGSLVKCRVGLVQGIATEKAKEVVKFIKDYKFKVTAQIQEKQVRVSGKSRDELQSVIAAVRGKDFGISLQFSNFRE